MSIHINPMSPMSGPGLGQSRESITPVYERPKSNRGFAGMDPQRQREIASAGGRAAHARGTAHEFTSEEAREAGRKGGTMSAKNRAKLPKTGD